MNHLITITKSDGTKQLFEEEKLVGSLKRVGASAEVIENVVDEVEERMKDGMTTEEIYSLAFRLLKSHSTGVAAKYSIRRAMLELGPDGFPFERFVARIFRMWGYDSLTDQSVLGRCVDHEVDVVAWKGDDLSMVEAKFHNVFGMKSDLKVALYVKARYDDIGGNSFNYGGKERKLTERWLITNTKFTEKAIQYGECSGLRMMGWNYPAKGSLHEVIERNGLHPVTCLNSLTVQEKRDLVGRNILTCIDVVAKPEVLTDIGIKGASAEKVIAEAQLIVEQSK